MYSNEIENVLRECGYKIGLKELNELIAHSPQCRYEIVSMDKDEMSAKLRIKFVDHNDIEITVTR